jgi:aryl-alcohol dehydrogenase-like predicted oxidoreductase
MSSIKRRKFISTFTSGLVGLGLAKNLKAESATSVPSQGSSTAPKIKKYNSLGKTGLKVSDISYGAISLFEPNVLRYAYECGVSYFDTAESYLRMKGETYVGQGLKGIRDKVVITTKHGYNFRQTIGKASILERVEASLKRLQSDYIDVCMIHSIDDLSPALNNQEVMSAYDQLKKDGKIRFTGFSTHNPKLTLKQALETDFAQVVLFMYNHMEGKEIEPLIKALKEKGIGTVAMKIFAGGMQGNLKSLVNKDVSYPQAAIRWVMSNSDIDTCIPTLSSYSHVEEYIAASGQGLNRTDLKLLESYQQQANDLYCRVSCRECLSACPNNVAVNDVLRYAMYFENFRREKEAIGYYAEMEPERKPLGCADCPGYCESACPYRLEVRNRLLHSHEILTA